MSDPTPRAAEPSAAHDPTLAEMPAANAAEPTHVEAAEAAETIEPMAAPDPVPPMPPQRRGMGPMPVIYAIGFVIIVVALVWLWQHPNRQGAAPAQQNAALDAMHNQMQALAQQVQDLSGRVTALENRPAPTAAAAPGAAPDLGSLEARVAALENRKPQAAPPAAAPPAAAPPQPDPAMQSRLAALTDKVNQLGQLQAGNADLAGRLDALAKSQQSTDADLAHRLDALATQAAASQREAAQISGLASTAQRTARLQAASVALVAGQPLGQIPGAPPALARFADTAPPTEAALRLSFPQAAAAAERASRPSLEGKPFFTRLWLRAQQVVTVREDEHVIIGDPASGIIARARRALDAGDLAGCVTALGALEGPAAQAMAGWLDQARALLAARAALAGMTTAG
jgi:hypothetical protein